MQDDIDGCRRGGEATGSCGPKKRKGADRMVAASRELHEACLRLVEGQYLDMAFERRGDVSLDEYVTMAMSRSSSL